MAVKNKPMPTMERAARMNEAALRKIVTKYARDARKRANRFVGNKTYTSPALARAEKSKAKDQTALFESHGKNRNQLLREYARIKQFLKDKTSTITGTKRWYAKTARKISDQIEGSVKAGDLDKIFEAISKAEEKIPEVGNVKIRYQAFQAINEMLEDDREMTVDDIVTQLEGLVPEFYQAMVDEEGFIDVSPLEEGEIEID